MPKVLLAGDVSVWSHVGGVPVMKPFAHTRSAPLTIAPIASVMMSGSMRHRWQMKPTVPPPTIARAAIRARVAPNDHPRDPFSWTSRIAPIPIQAAIEKSMPPTRTQSVWPAVAMPSSAARTSIE